MTTQDMPIFGISEYIQRIHGLALTGQETVTELTTLFRDLINFLSFLKEDVIHPVLSKLVELWQKHHNFLLPIIGKGREAFTRIFTDENVKEKICDALSQVVNNLPRLILIESVGVLCYQIYEWYEVYEVVKKINGECEQIENKMLELRDGAKELKNLLLRLGDKISDAEETLLLRKIDQKLGLIRLNYQPTLNLIEKVHKEILENERRLEESTKCNTKNAILSGVSGVLSLGLIVVNPLSTTIGVINAVAGAAICGSSIYLNSFSAQILRDFSLKRLILDQYETELVNLKQEYDNFAEHRNVIMSRKVSLSAQVLSF